MRLFYDFTDEEVDWTVKQLLKRKWHVKNISGDIEKLDGFAIEAKCNGHVYRIWIDVDGDGWAFNKYIFSTLDAYDCVEEKLQGNDDFVYLVDTIVDRVREEGHFAMTYPHYLVPLTCHVKGARV